MTTTIRNKEVIRAWLDGKDIQFKYLGHLSWTTYSQKEDEEAVMPAFQSPRLEWRIAPNKKWYRVARCVENGHECAKAYNTALEEKNAESLPIFIEWLTDRVYYDEMEWVY